MQTATVMASDFAATDLPVNYVSAVDGWLLSIGRDSQGMPFHAGIRRWCNAAPDRLHPPAAPSIPQPEAQHVQVLYAVLENRLGVVSDEEVMVNAGHPETMALVEGQLVAERTGTHLQLAGA